MVCLDKHKVKSTDVFPDQITSVAGNITKFSASSGSSQYTTLSQSSQNRVKKFKTRQAKSYRGRERECFPSKSLIPQIVREIKTHCAEVI